jgi:hypothetical protein
MGSGYINFIHFRKEKDHGKVSLEHTEFSKGGRRAEAQGD